MHFIINYSHFLSVKNFRGANLRIGEQGYGYVVFSDSDSPTPSIESILINLSDQYLPIDVNETTDKFSGNGRKIYLGFRGLREVERCLGWILGSGVLSISLEGKSA